MKTETKFAIALGGVALLSGAIYFLTRPKGEVRGEINAGVPQSGSGPGPSVNSGGGGTNINQGGGGGNPTGTFRQTQSVPAWAYSPAPMGGDSYAQQPTFPQFDAEPGL